MRAHTHTTHAHRTAGFYFSEKETARLLVRNSPQNVTLEDLEAIFGQFDGFCGVEAVGAGAGGAARVGGGEVHTLARRLDDNDLTEEEKEARRKRVALEVQEERDELASLERQVAAVPVLKTAHAGDGSAGGGGDGEDSDGSGGVEDEHVQVLEQRRAREREGCGLVAVVEYGSIEEAKLVKGALEGFAFPESPDQLLRLDFATAIHRDPLEIEEGEGASLLPSKACIRRAAAAAAASAAAQEGARALGDAQGDGDAERSGAMPGGSGSRAREGARGAVSSSTALSGESCDYWGLENKGSQLSDSF